MCFADRVRVEWVALLIIVASASICFASDDPDTDGDGLSDFQEVHKYLTDPSKKDSDGDGKHDGDWYERREYQYTIRSVVQVMRPVTFDYLNDNYQDARVIDETDQYVELEVIHYPFNTIESTIKSNAHWRSETNEMKEWVSPGPTSDWTPELKQEIENAMLDSGIDVDKLGDRELVELASKFLCDRAEYEDGFTTFVTAWGQDGKPFIPDGLRESVQQGLTKKDRRFQDQWAREVSAAGMFRNKARGSCTSSAIYLSGCLKALGVPTRTILCIPVIDASDEREIELLKNVSHGAVRQHLQRSLKPMRQTWSSHTFNEVHVGGRWHRLNYSRLGQGTYDRNLFGLITHVATFNDWADAKAHETIGRRQKSVQPKDVFGFRNPYSTIALRDQIGVHCKVKLPAEPEPDKHLVRKIWWTDDPELPDAIVENCKRTGRFGLIARVSIDGGKQELLDFMEGADLSVSLNPENSDQPQLKVGFDSGCFWITGETAMIYLPLGVADRRDLRPNVPYNFQPRDDSKEQGWQVPEKLLITRIDNSDA